MVLKLHGFHLSPATRRVLLVLKECDVPFEFISVDLRKGEHKSPEYLTKHPFGVVPLIVRFFPGLLVYTLADR